MARRRLKLVELTSMNVNSQSQMGFNHLNTHSYYIYIMHPTNYQLYSVRITYYQYSPRPPEQVKTDLTRSTVNPQRDNSPSLVFGYPERNSFLLYILRYRLPNDYQTIGENTRKRQLIGRLRSIAFQ